MINPGNYPGSYEEVIAVAAVDCANQLATFSQKNPTVDLAAPGVNILSTASRSYPPRAGLMAGGFMSDNPKIYIPGGIASSENQVRFSGAGKFTGKVVDCGTGSTACPQAKNSICLVQYDPQLKPGDLGKASSAGSTGGTGIRGSVFSQMALSTFGEEAAPITGVQEKPVTPGKFFCDAVEFCMSSGAKAVLLGNPNITTGFYGAYSMQQPATFYDLPLIANLDCSDANCSCWQRISALPDKPPTAGLSLGQYAKVKAAVADAAKAGRTFVGTVESQVSLACLPRHCKQSSCGQAENSQSCVRKPVLTTLWIALPCQAVWHTAQVTVSGPLMLFSRLRPSRRGILNTIAHSCAHRTCAYIGDKGT